MNSDKKQIAVITGASSGMGREFALTLSGHGSFDEVWLIARTEEKLRETAEKIPFPARVLPYDLTEPASLSTLKALLETEKPSVRLLVNASGFGRFTACENLDENDSLGMIDLNCRALTALTQMCLPYMTEGARVVEFASVAAFQPTPYINIYAASKAYVLSYSRALNRELAGRGIRVFAICPFWTKTAFFDRAIHSDEPTVVKHYAAMYEPEFIVRKAWHVLEKTKKDHLVPGLTARLQVLAVRILPHSLVMKLWMSQQKLN